MEIYRILFKSIFRIIELVIGILLMALMLAWIMTIAGLYFAIKALMTGNLEIAVMIIIFDLILISLFLTFQTLEKSKCKHVIRKGESCRLNNNCKYPNCEN